MKMKLFDHEALEPAIDDPELQNTLHPILNGFKPGDSVPALSDDGTDLIITWQSSIGTVVLRFVNRFLYRHGHPSPTASHQYWLWSERVGAPEVGIYYLPQSDLLRTPHETWVGVALPLDKSFSLQHFVVVFNDSVLECLCSRMEYRSGPGPSAKA